MKKELKIVAFMIIAVTVCMMAPSGYASEAALGARDTCRALYAGPEKHKYEICSEMAKVLNVTMKAQIVEACSNNCVRRESTYGYETYTSNCQTARGQVYD